MHRKPPEAQAVGLAEATSILGYKDSATVMRLIEGGQLHAFRARSPSGMGAWRISRVSINRLLEGTAPQEQNGIADNAGNMTPGIKPLKQR